MFLYSLFHAILVADVLKSLHTNVGDSDAVGHKAGKHEHLIPPSFVILQRQINPALFRLIRVEVREYRRLFDIRLLQRHRAPPTIFIRLSHSHLLANLILWFEMISFRMRTFEKAFANDNVILILKLNFS